VLFADYLLLAGKQLCYKSRKAMSATFSFKYVLRKVIAVLFNFSAEVQPASNKITWDGIALSVFLLLVRRLAFYGIKVF